MLSRPASDGFTGMKIMKADVPVRMSAIRSKVQQRTNPQKLDARVAQNGKRDRPAWSTLRTTLYSTRSSDWLMNATQASVAPAI